MIKPIHASNSQFVEHSLPFPAPEENSHAVAQGVTFGHKSSHTATGIDEVMRSRAAETCSIPGRQVTMNDSNSKHSTSCFLLSSHNHLPFNTPSTNHPVALKTTSGESNKTDSSTAVPKGVLIENEEAPSHLRNPPEENTRNKADKLTSTHVRTSGTNPIDYHPRAMNLSSLNLASLDGLEVCATLQVLILQNNDLKSFYGLPTLPSLRFLHAEGNQISSFLGMSYQPQLELLSLESNPITHLPHFRVMALLACGESLTIVNHCTVRPEERSAAERHGGSGGLTARALSYGWTDFQPDYIVPRTQCEELLVKLRERYTRICLSLDASRSVHQIQEPYQRPQVQPQGEQHSRPMTQQIPVTRTPMSTSSLVAHLHATECALNVLHSNSGSCSELHVRPDPKESDLSTPTWPPNTSNSRNQRETHSHTRDTVPVTVPAPSLQEIPALHLNCFEFGALTSFTLCQQLEFSLRLIRIEYLSSSASKSNETVLSESIALTIFRNGMMHLHPIANPEKITLRIDLVRALDISYHHDRVWIDVLESARTVAPQNEGAAEVLGVPTVYALELTHALAPTIVESILCAVFKCALSVKCTPTELRVLYASSSPFQSAGSASLGGGATF